MIFLGLIICRQCSNSLNIYELNWKHPALIIFLILSSILLVGSAIASMCGFPLLAFNAKEVLDFDIDKTIYNSLEAIDILSFLITIFLVGFTYYYLYYIEKIKKEANNMINQDNLLINDDKPKLTEDEIRGGFVLDRET